MLDIMADVARDYSEKCILVWYMEVFKMPLLETIFTVANLTNFLGKIYDTWRFLQEKRESGALSSLIMIG